MEKKARGKEERANAQYIGRKSTEIEKLRVIYSAMLLRLSMRCFCLSQVNSLVGHTHGNQGNKFPPAQVQRPPTLRPAQMLNAVRPGGISEVLRVLRPKVIAFPWEPGSGGLHKGLIRFLPSQSEREG